MRCGDVHTPEGTVLGGLTRVGGQDGVGQRRTLQQQWGSRMANQQDLSSKSMGNLGTDPPTHSTCNCIFSGPSSGNPLAMLVVRGSLHLSGMATFPHLPATGLSTLRCPSLTLLRSSLMPRFLPRACSSPCHSLFSQSTSWAAAHWDRC